jgi:antitoxin HicB
MSKLQYSMLIRWSDEDQCYVVWLPEFGPHCHTHGATYEAAAKNGREVLELLVSSEAHPPKPILYGSGETITPPAHESKLLESDWYEKLTRELEHKRGNPPAPKRAAG